MIEDLALTFVEAVPTPAEYNYLRQTIGWVEREEAVVSIVKAWIQQL